MSRNCYGVFLAVENRRCRGKPPFFVSVTIRAVMIRGSLFQVSFALVCDVLSIFRAFFVAEDKKRSERKTFHR